MKTLRLLLIAIVVSLFTACTKDKQYSCNPEVNAWVERNLDEIKQMNRSQFLEIPNEAYQRAAFRVFSPQQKMQIWTDKVTELLQLEWNAAEKSHIIRLQNIVLEHAVWFYSQESKAKIEEIDDDISLTMFEWAEYAYDELHWTREQVYAIAVTPNKIQNFQNIVVRKSRLDDLGGEDLEEPEKPGLDWSALTCDCNLEHDFCFSSTCKNLPCGDPGTGGCGWFCLQKCNGLCW